MAEHEESTDVAPHGVRRCSTHRCRNRAVWPGPRRGWPATQAGGEGSVLRVVGAPSAGASPREPGGRGTEELAVGPSERVVVGLGVGIVVLSVLNAGIMLKRRWLSMWGLAGMLGFLALLIEGMVEAVL